MKALCATPAVVAATGALTLVLLAPAGFAIEPARLSGALTGRVTDSSGIPQMGATVLLFNRFDRLIARSLTDEHGKFLFDSLIPELYSIRVTLSSFMPAFRRNVQIQPGASSFLAVSLTSMLSSVELVYMAPGQPSLMSEEWKWVLRSAGATRPVLRILPDIDISDPTRRTQRLGGAVFSDTRGMLRLSAGEGSALAAVGNQTDLGTAFALATSLFGVNQLAFSGNVGYASNAGIPTTGFSTSFSRLAGAGAGPEVNVTMRQVFLPARIGAALAGRQGNVPALQTVSVSFSDRRQLGDNFELEYGSSMESVSFLNRLNYLSPFGRLRWGTDDDGALELAFSSGAPATELLNPGEVAGQELQHQLLTLSLFPRVSLRGGQARVQRTENFEVGYRRRVGTHTLSASVWRESVSNAALTMAAPGGFYPATELLPDLASNSSVFNAGNYRRMGYQAAIGQQFGERFGATVAYGYAGALSTRQSELATSAPAELRGLLRRAWRHSLTARVFGSAPFSGTRYSASYQWTAYDALLPVHLSLTQRATTLEPGLNFSLRQPIPGVPGVIPGRLEASAELRNLLAQGYLPLTTSDGRRVVLIQSPRAVRGGLSFIF